jgi:hypothetical protein
MSEKIAIGIMTSALNLKDRFEACLNTWVNDFTIHYLFGGYCKNENLIQLPNVGEDYSSCLLKQQLGLKYIYEKHPDIDWVCMCGCDTILFKNNIINELNEFNPNDLIFLGQTNGYMNVNGTNILTVAGGGGFFISNAVLKLIYPKIDMFNDFWYNLSVSGRLPVPYAISDIAIGYMLKLYFNIDPIHTSGMFSQNPDKYTKENNFCNLPETDIKCLDKPLSYHYIKPDDMKNVYLKFK